ncbi:MAG TPA: hypothetical protein VHC21_02880 [Candidatus Saccharimonadales bacterium]|nr:hypothetical protein [Candidatus Saccharimonadales bacterium]
MARRPLYRNIYARDHLEIFLVTAISALLINRFFLHITHYPSVGGSKYHIAHMLYGGLLMLTAIVINLSFLGVRIQKLCAFIAGIGFGLFIDELGKFITRDNNYFFRPTIGLIYAIFAILYLIFNFLTRRQQLSSDEYQLNALQQLEEAVRKDMDRYEKAATLALLARADQADPITEQLQALVRGIKPVRHAPSRYQRWQAAVKRAYDRFWNLEGSGRLVGAVFVIEALIFLGVVIGNLTHSFNSLHELFQHYDSYSTKLLIGQLASSVVASIFAIIGAFQLRRSRLQAYEYFRRALLVNIFLTEFFTFTRIQFGALPGLAVNLALFIILRAALQQESRAGK